MNQVHPRIKFEIEKPTGNPEGLSLSLLDFTVTITDQGPSTFEFYKKKAIKPLFVHYKSALPSTTKMNIISNERKRIEQRCSDPHIRTKHNNNFDNVLRLNGYPQAWIDCARQPSTTTEPQAEPNHQWFYLKIPYVSDALDFRIKNIFRKEEIPIRVAHQSYSLRQALSTQTTERGCTRENCPMPNKDHCFKKNTIYKITCTKCKEIYIGSSTIRHTHDRIRNKRTH
ncbi:hypothetical protein QZH41_004531 [Actinostola sp. cb2023]|nr:hypothetical protein QZH41_004531 [Actinostola sp. cb2023]